MERRHESEREADKQRIAQVENKMAENEAYAKARIRNYENADRKLADMQEKNRELENVGIATKVLNGLKKLALAPVRAVKAVVNWITGK